MPITELRGHINRFGAPFVVVPPPPEAVPIDGYTRTCLGWDSDVSQQSGRLRCCQAASLRRSCGCGHPGGVETGLRPGGGVFVAADVHYLACGGARAAAVIAADAAFFHLGADRVRLVPDVEPYLPGQFYLRELPALRAVLDGLSEMALLVVDGYADLDPDGRPGLGARAHAEFAVPVIGVAKSAFRTATHAIPVLRGASARPLYVTAAGMPPTDAANLVRHMTGRYRIPNALRRADTLARAGLPQPTRH